MLRKFSAAQEKVRGRARARHPLQYEVALLLNAKRAGRGEVCLLRNRAGDRTSLEREEKLDSFGVAACFKNRRLRSDTVHGRDRASY